MILASTMEVKWCMTMDHIASHSIQLTIIKEDWLQDTKIIWLTTLIMAILVSWSFISWVFVWKEINQKFAKEFCIRYNSTPQDSIRLRSISEWNVNN